jgi:hypothetical protein
MVVDGETGVAQAMAQQPDPDREAGLRQRRTDRAFLAGAAERSERLSRHPHRLQPVVAPDRHDHSRDRRVQMHVFVGIGMVER